MQPCFLNHVGVCTARSTETLVPSLQKLLSVSAVAGCQKALVRDALGLERGHFGLVQPAYSRPCCKSAWPSPSNPACAHLDPGRPRDVTGQFPGAFPEFSGGRLLHGADRCFPGWTAPSKTARALYLTVIATSNRGKATTPHSMQTSSAGNPRKIQFWPYWRRVLALLAMFPEYHGNCYKPCSVTCPRLLQSLHIQVRFNARQGA